MSVEEKDSIDGSMSVISYMPFSSFGTKETIYDDSDYEHYPDLKEFFITTSSLFSFCRDPDGSLENTINDYRNKARDYYYDLSYVFEESEIADKKEEE